MKRIELKTIKEDGTKFPYKLELQRGIDSLEDVEIGSDMDPIELETFKEMDEVMIKFERNYIPFEMSFHLIVQDKTLILIFYKEGRVTNSTGRELEANFEAYELSMDIIT